VDLAGRPMLAWSLDALARAATISSVIVAAPPGSEAAIEALAGDVIVEGAGRLEVLVTAGGETRSQSVALAVELADAAVIAVHDAARPLVTPELVDDLVALLASDPGAAAVIAAAPITDTVKRAAAPRSREGADAVAEVASTESRDHLWAAQTPQVFRAAALRAALGGDPAHLLEATDDAMLVERAGGRVLMRPSPGPNLKVTTPFDARIVAGLLAVRQA
jgi:2-C-methyl-D-erythritol 4-phosphate cytidylyltransferase